MKYRFISFSVLLITLGVLLVGCQPLAKLGAENSSAGAPLQEATITALNFTYTPETVTVRGGATIRFTNRDAVEHTITSDDGSSFDSGIVGQDGTGEFTAPTTPGTYTYHCTPHPSMTGTIIVAE